MFVTTVGLGSDILWSNLFLQTKTGQRPEELDQGRVMEFEFPRPGKFLHLPNGAVDRVGA